MSCFRTTGEKQSIENDQGAIFAISSNERIWGHQMNLFIYYLVAKLC